MKITKLPNGGELRVYDNGKNGNKSWYLNNKLHRLHGPAIIMNNGDKFWYVDGERHRIDGPAIEYIDGFKEYYLNGKYLPPIQFKRLIKLKAFW